jgi:5-amino-6-(5-phosphoribosylamino)uracil reductase
VDVLWPTSDDGPTGVTDDTELARILDFPTPLNRPWVKVLFVASADGAVTVDGRSGGLSDPNDKRIFRLGRGLADAVLVGAGTATAERYRGAKPKEMPTELRKARNLKPVPTIAVVTRRCSIEPTSPLFTDTEAPTIVFTANSAPQARRAAIENAGGEVIATGDDDVDLTRVIQELDNRGMRRVACEGGPALFAAMIAAGLVDELELSVAPLLAGGTAGRIATGPQSSPTPLKLAGILHAGNLLLLRYLRA